MSYSTGRFNDLLKKDLMDWVWNNPKLLHKITKRELEFLFEVDPQRGLSIDLRRFEIDYYKATFYPPEEKKKHIDEFVRKVCGVIYKTLKTSGREDITITITVRHMISEVSHWKTFFISEAYDNSKLSPLNKKDQDWFNKF
ncbi:hypothetical protein [Mucilaginibacter pedocola]|uniref:Uncharacterized protein n=1 Tax=Mucilaginibacter pedocola TaxID=1792845 RepID=A0A1S9PHD1_9SPHI|nr:hypothetical protein [Mucilaginibacter pedocola]OOQ60367.1 hypothetical protein BC343_25430 [Mucilaginibacter pedocola]